MKSIYQIHKFKSLIQITCFILSLVSCSSPNSSSSPSQSPVQLGQSLVIDSAGTVPIFAGSPSSSVIYVHNNGSKTITGIKYTASDSNIKSSNTERSNTIMNFKHETISKLSIQNCEVINPGQSCPISFTTATPDSADFKGSIVITLSYKLENTQKEFSQIINYAQINNQTENGAVIASGVKIIANSDFPTYGVVYAYGAGNNQIYAITKLKLDKSGFSITQGNIVGQQLSSNAIQAIEIKAPAMTNSAVNTVKLAITSNNINTPSSSFTSTVDNLTTILPIANGAILIIGNSPVINVSKGVTGTINVYNAGNSPTTPGAVSAGSGVSITNNTCTNSIAANAYCAISFSVTSGAIAGNATITIPYAPGIESSIASTVYWYTNGGPLLGISNTPSPIIFNTNAGESVTVSVTNLGAVPINSLTVPKPSIVSGVGTAVLNGTGNTCDGITLAVGESCSYVVNMSATAATDGSVNFGISGDYLDATSTSQSYSRSLNDGYTVVSYAALLNVTVPNFTILGDGVATKTQNVTINNIGVAPATLMLESITNTTGYTTILSGTSCVSPLAAGESCTTQAITFGPVTNGTGSTIVVKGTSDTFAFKIPYSGGETTETTASANLNTTITVNTNLTISKFTATGSSTGLGVSGSPFVFPGSSPQGQVVTVTYQNSGSTAINTTGISNLNSGFQWEIDTTNSSCYANGIPGKTLSVGEDCTVIFNNVVSSNFLGLGNIGANYTMNLLLPKITYVTNPGGVQYEQTPTTPENATSIFVNSTQATLVNTISESGTIAGYGTVSITSTLANTSGYNSMAITSTMEDYFTGVPTVTNCTQNTTTPGIRTQVCTLTSESGGNGVYLLDSRILVDTVLHVNFALTSVSPTGAVVSFSPLNSSLILK